MTIEQWIFASPSYRLITDSGNPFPLAVWAGSFFQGRIGERMKKSDLNALMSEELKELHRLVEEILDISEPAFLEHGTSAFLAALFNDLGSEYRQQAEKAHADFDCLCQAAPHVPMECLRNLSMAYRFFFDSPPEDETEIEQVRTLMVVAHYKGMAIAALSADETKKSEDEAKEFERKALQSIQARNAARGKHKYTDAIKEFALEHSQTLEFSKLNDKTAAKRLVSILPENLVDKSDDPERLIYDELRKKKKLKLAGRT